MAANVRTEMRIPTRSAPPPPIGARPQQRTRIWSSTSNIFGSATTPQLTQKKKPPPRPPPPKFAASCFQSQQDKHRRATRPTELLTNFFGKKKHEQFNAFEPNSQLPSATSQSSSHDASMCLIDLSPPGSPTFTTRSNSDGVSIDSFGSDGNSNPSIFTSSGNTSQTESAFEDDFDFFGPISIKKKPQSEPWQEIPMPDPFGPLEEPSVLQTVAQPANTGYHRLNGDKSYAGSSQAAPSRGMSIHSMPTIIRTKPPKPPAPKVLLDKLQQDKQHMPTTAHFGLAFNEIPSALSNKSLRLDIGQQWPINNRKEIDSPSPPMPTIPPPAPPSEFLTEAGNQDPYGVALYDYPLTHPDDLSFREGDIIKLVRKINDDWMVGQIGNHQGMFPCNYIDVKIPLPGVPDNTVTAVYAFKAEIPEDLSFDEGAKITVLSRISEDWLYGECSGRKGQFPANYVNRIPRNLPQA